LVRIDAALASRFKPPTIVSSSTRPPFSRAADRRIFEPPTAVSSSRRRQSAGIPTHKGAKSPETRQRIRLFNPTRRLEPAARYDGWAEFALRIRIYSIRRLSYLQAPKYHIFEPPTIVSSSRRRQSAGIPTNKGAKSPETRQRIRLLNQTRRLAPAARYGRWSGLTLRLQVVSSRQLSYLQAPDHRFLKPPTILSSSTRPPFSQAADRRIFKHRTTIFSSRRPPYLQAPDHHFLEPPTPVGGYPNPQGRQVARNPPAHPLIQSNPPACAGGSIWSLVRIDAALASRFKPPTILSSSTRPPFSQAADRRIFKHRTTIFSSRRPPYLQAPDHHFLEPPTPVGGYPNPQVHQVARNPPAHPLIQSNPPACAGGSIWSLVNIGYSLVNLFKPPTTIVWKHQLSYFQAGNYRIFEPPTPVGGYPNPQGRQFNWL
jgi:hypothetical protein